MSQLITICFWTNHISTGFDLPWWNAVDRCCMVDFRSVTKFKSVRLLCSYTYQQYTKTMFCVSDTILFASVDRDVFNFKSAFSFWRQINGANYKRLERHVCIYISCTVVAPGEPASDVLLSVYSLSQHKLFWYFSLDSYDGWFNSEQNENTEMEIQVSTHSHTQNHNCFLVMIIILCIVNSGNKNTHLILLHITVYYTSPNNSNCHAVT